MKFFITAILIGTCMMATAQEVKTYAETQREQEWKKYQDNYNAGNSRNNNSTSNSSGGVDPNAAKDLADQWRRNAGKRTAAEQQAWEAGEAERERQRKATENQRKNEEFQAIANTIRYKQALAAREESRRPEVEKKTKEIFAGGFRFDEARRFAGTLTPYPDPEGIKGFQHPLAVAGRQKVKNTIAAHAKFEATKTSASFDELASLVRTMNNASVTAMEAWQFLGKRFPEYKDFTEREEFYSMIDLMHVDLGEDGLLTKDQQFVLDRFWVLYEKYPAEAIYSMRLYEPWYSPFARKGFSRTNTATRIDKKWSEIMFLTKAEKTNDQSRQEWHWFSFVGSENKKYWKAKTPAYWREMAALADIPVISVFERFAYLQDESLRKGSGWMGKGYDVYPLKEEYKVLIDEMGTMAEEGDIGCMNAYGLQLAAGKNSSLADRKKGFKLMEQARKGGSTWAAFNILFCTEAGHKGGPTVEEATNQLHQLFDNASPQNKFAAARIIMDYMPYKGINPRHTFYAYQLSEQAAAAGYAPAIKSISDVSWILYDQVPKIKDDKPSGMKYATLSIPGQTTLFNNWESFKNKLGLANIEYPVTDPNIYRNYNNNKLTTIYKNSDVVHYNGALNLKTEEPDSYTFKASLTMIGNSENGASGLVVRGKYVKNSQLYFMVNPTNQQYKIMAWDEVAKNWINLSKKTVNYPYAVSSAINAYDKSGRSENELTIEKKGSRVSFSVNNLILETVNVAEYPLLLKSIFSLGVASGNALHIALTKDIFFSYKE